MLDVESFSTLLTQCHQRCWLVAAAVTGDRAEADDIVQEASMIALRKRGDFTVGTDFSAWISQIVRLTALNHIKKAERRSVVTDPAAFDREGAQGASGAPTHDPITADGRLTENQGAFDDDLLSALRQIGDVARACLLLRVVQQLSYDEIATTLHIPPGTAMSHVHRAKEAIRQHLRQRYRQSAKGSSSQEQR